MGLIQPLVGLFERSGIRPWELGPSSLLPHGIYVTRCGLRSHTPTLRNMLGCAWPTRCRICFTHLLEVTHREIPKSFTHCHLSSNWNKTKLAMNTINQIWTRRPPLDPEMPKITQLGGLTGWQMTRTAYRFFWSFQYCSRKPTVIGQLQSLKCNWRTGWDHSHEEIYGRNNGSSHGPVRYLRGWTQEHV